MIELCEIESIEPYGEAETYDLKVADNHNFFLANGILTHNSGKDSTTGMLMCNDIAHGRTVVIIDAKMEYPLSILCQQDPVLVNLLNRNGVAGRGYKVNLWVPYVYGMENNNHFQLLLKLHHPNLKVRPFRILKSTLISDDTANMTLQKSAMQAMASRGGKEKLGGQLAKYDKFKEEMGMLRLGLDDMSIWDEGCGWEYMDFDEMARNGEVNVITTYFMLGSKISTVSYMIGIVNELLTIGMGSHRLREKNEVFSIIIPEIQMLMPKRVRALENVVNTLQYSMLVGFLLMRSFDVRFRINLQNLSALLPDMYSQSRLFIGKTANPKDLNLLGLFNIKKELRVQFLNLATGDFVDVFRKRKFNMAPFFHKSREREFLAGVLQEFEANPAKFLFNTPHGLLSEILNYEHLGLRFPCCWLAEYAVGKGPYFSQTLD